MVLNSSTSGRNNYVCPSFLLSILLPVVFVQGFLPQSATTVHRPVTIDHNGGCKTSIQQRIFFQETPASRTKKLMTRLYENKLWDRLQVEEDEEPFWYLVNCVAGLEMDLLRQCRDICKDMPDAIKFVVPTEVKTRSHGAKRMVTETKVKYQGYVFAKLRLCPETYEAVQQLDLCRSWMGTVNHKGHKKLPPAPVALNELEVENFGLEDLEFEEEEAIIPEEGEKDIIVDEAEDEKKRKQEEEAIKVFLGIKVDDMVKVTKKCKFFNEDGIVRRLKDGKIFLRFYTYGSMFEEWMDPEDVRKLTDTEVLKGLSGPTEPVTQRDFEEESDEYDSDGRKKAGTFRRDLMSNMGGTQDRNRRQDRVGRGQLNRDFNGDETNRKKEEKNWDWYKENKRDNKGVVADDEYSYRPGSERDDALGDADAQWNRPTSQRQERKERNNKSDGDWSKFVSPASAPKKSGGEDDFFASLMTGLNKDLNTGDAGRSSSPPPESAEDPSSSAGKEEDDFFASLMAEIDSADDTNSGSSADADSSLLVDDFFSSLDTSNKESSGETKSEAKDSSFNEDDLFDSFDVIDKKSEESGDLFSAFDLDGSKSKSSKAPEGDEDDFFASLEAELGSALDTEENTPSIDGNDDFFATLEKEVFAKLDDNDDESAEEKAPKGEPKSKASAASASHAPANGGEDLVKLTVPKLKEMLKAQGLKVGGKKAELIERLQEQQR